MHVTISFYKACERVSCPLSEMLPKHNTVKDKQFVDRTHINSLLKQLFLHIIKNKCVSTPMN